MNQQEAEVILGKEEVEQAKQNEGEDKVIDPIKQLTTNQNPLPLLAVIDELDLEDKNQDGIPLFNLLCNKFLPIGVLLNNKKFQLQNDKDQRSALHYAVEVDDVKAAYECLRRGAQNSPDNFGNTPIEDAIRLGHKRCFLLCIHFQHYSETLPHTAAKYNRVWELRVLNNLGFNMEGLNHESLTPLQIAVSSYSYESASYLTKISKNVNISLLSQLTDSKAMIRRVSKVHSQNQTFQKCLPFLLRIMSWFLVVITITSTPFFEITHETRIVQLLMALGVLLMVPLLSTLIKNKKQRRNQPILDLLKEPYFPVLQEICPDCLCFCEEGYDHCDECKCCVKKLHMHSIFCINSTNEVVWISFEIIWVWLLASIFSQILTWHRINHLVVSKSSFIYDFLFSMDYCLINSYYFRAFLIISMLIVLIEQILRSLQIFGMMFMNRTYQQVQHSERYPNLYEPYKTKQGKIKLKEKRLFMKYKLLLAPFVGLKNIVTYFFERS